MGAKIAKLTQKRVRELFNYRDGNLVRTISRGSSKSGDIAGWLTDNGYLVTRIDGKLYYNHRIIWLWHCGYTPENFVDHVDRNRTNNRIGNLREVSQTCNLRNMKQRESVSGVKGVVWHNKLKKWTASIKISGKRIHLGISSSILEAACIRLAAEQAEGWEGCESSSPAFVFVRKNLLRSNTLARKNFLKM